ncbi:hypothetical protein BO78DRAFT_55434 [Aspergillus sclerotiicarbonarius CBS 121057]|uniref:Uncharacterized protein n=1 Tax=Aspergillus sclerotiicarbonarius (strain CBS 121057 / IBT 28362) TaxID=1448318 RepID=A0A319FL57_ASPSB|nr:hypothetical protein BO78DRAFT_55434 [Aspergillus sclerotiicarbonarius CBS 121057]
MQLLGLGSRQQQQQHPPGWSVGAWFLGHEAGSWPGEDYRGEELRTSGGSGKPAWRDMAALVAARAAASHWWCHMTCSLSGRSEETRKPGCQDSRMRGWECITVMVDGVQRHVYPALLGKHDGGPNPMTCRSAGGCQSECPVPSVKDPDHPGSSRTRLCHGATRINSNRARPEPPDKRCDA